MFSKFLHKFLARSVQTFKSPLAPTLQKRFFFDIKVNALISRVMLRAEINQETVSLRSLLVRSSEYVVRM